MDKTPFSVYDFLAYLSSGSLVVACFDYLGEYGLANRLSISPVLILYLVVAAYMLGQISAHLSSILLETGLVYRVLKPPITHLLDVEARSWKTIVFPGFFKPLPSGTRDRIHARAELLGVNWLGPEMFFHCLAVVTAESDKTQERLDSFRNQYGFARNASFSLLISGIAIFSVILSGNHHPQKRWAIIAITASIVMVYRYLKFFRQYSYEILFRYAEAKKGT